MKTNFDCNGKPIDTNIQKGDTVLYMDSVSKMCGDTNLITVKKGLHGIWDGEKVQFKDRDMTIVKNVNWLIKLEKQNP